MQVKSTCSIISTGSWEPCTKLNNPVGWIRLLRMDMKVGEIAISNRNQMAQCSEMWFKLYDLTVTVHPDLDLKVPLLVNLISVYLAAGDLVDGDALANDWRLVDRALTLNDRPVEWALAAGADDNCLALLIGGYRYLLAVLRLTVASSGDSPSAHAESPTLCPSRSPRVVRRY